LIPYCGLEVQKPTLALQSVKGPGNTFDINYKWSKTLPSSIYFSWDINRAPPCPPGVSIKGITRAFSRLKCLGGFLHLKPTAGVQKYTLVFDFFYGGGLY
jgi:hypothetical protein